MNHDGVAIISGGLDSVTMLEFLVKRQDKRPWCLSFYYGQRHAKEVSFANQAAERHNLAWTLVDLDDVGQLLSMDPSSSLVNNSVPVPHGHYSAETMKGTVVPNRNMMMLSIATSVCIAIRGSYVATGPHNGDAAIYPDCRPLFLQSFEETVRRGNVGFLQPDWSLETPFIHWSKTDIAREAKRLNVPVELTWSCYEGDDIHCGRCGTCVERMEALHAAGFTLKSTDYKDLFFWKEQHA